MADTEQRNNPEVDPQNGESSSQQPQQRQKKSPPKLNKKQKQEQNETNGVENQPDGEAEDAQPNGEEKDIKQEDQDQDQDQEQEPEPEPEPEPQRKPRRQRRSRPQKQESDTEEIPRPDMDSPGGRRTRTRGKRGSQQQGGGGPLGGLGGIDDVGNTVNGAGELVQNTAGKAVNGVTNTAGKAVGGALGGGGEDKEDGKDEQLRLRLDLNLDIEVQLKAKIHGDLTLGLLYVFFSLHLYLVAGIQGLLLTSQIIGTKSFYIPTINHPWTCPSRICPPLRISWCHDQNNLSFHTLSSAFSVNMYHYVLSATCLCFSTISIALSHHV